MADYWEGRASRPHGGPNGEGTNYVQPDFGGVDFAVPQTIEEIRQKIMNQHPEDIAALADQWQNAYNLLSSIKQQLFDQSTTLYNEYWRDARARAEFMRRGPGETLAYLDEWMDSAMNNVTALRGLVTIAQNSRDRMETLWQQYQDDVAAAEDISAGDWARGAGKASWWFGEWNGMDGAREVATEDIQAAHEKANSDARALAEDVGREYTTYFSSMSSGHGPPFYEMNAVLNAPGHPPWPSLPSAPMPPGAPGAPPPLVAGPMPGAPPALAQATPTPPPTAAPAPPPVGAPPPVPAPAVAPTAPPGLPGPVIAPVVAPVPAPPVGKLGPGVAPGLPQTPPAQLPPGLPGGGARPPALRGGVLQGSGASGPSAPAMPPPQGGRTLGRTPPRADPAAPDTQRRGTAVPSDVDETFTRPPMSTAPPVLNSARPGPSRPGDRQPATPVRHPGQPDGPVPWRPADTAPPVLNSPGRSPGHLEPPVPGRPGRGRSDGPGRTAPGPTPGTEWIGSDDARTDTTAPVLDAPVPPRPGSVSRLEEVPSRLRRRPDAAGRPGRKGAAPAELGTRRTKAGAPDRPTERAGDEAPRIVTDEDAFGVETPGGGVLAKQAEDRSYRPEPPAAITGA
jgi:hypothetical protein